MKRATFPLPLYLPSCVATHALSCLFLLRAAVCECAGVCVTHLYSILSGCCAVCLHVRVSVRVFLYLYICSMPSFVYFFALCKYTRNVAVAASLLVVVVYDAVVVFVAVFRISYVCQALCRLCCMP